MEEFRFIFVNIVKKNLPHRLVKSRTYPLRIILDSITLYNRLYTTKEIVAKIFEKYGFKLSEQTILNWAKGYKDYLPFLRLRDFVSKNILPKTLLMKFI